MMDGCRVLALLPGGFGCRHCGLVLRLYGCRLREMLLHCVNHGCRVRYPVSVSSALHRVERMLLELLQLATLRLLNLL